MIASEGLSSEIVGLTRTIKTDIDAAIKAGLNSIHTFIATSDIHLEYKLKMTKEQALEKAIEAVEYGKSCGLQPDLTDYFHHRSGSSGQGQD